MKTFYVMTTVVVFIVFASCLLAAESSGIRIVGDRDIPEFLNIAVPDEYASFSKINGEKDELVTSKSVLALLDKVYQQQQEQPCKVSINKPGGIIELMAWKLVLKTYKSIEQPEGRALIKQAWHKYLEMDRENRSPQLYALANDWDESLMTDESIEVFKTTLDPMTITGFVRVFMNHGEDKELALLKDKQASVEANLKGVEPAYSTARVNIRMGIDTIESWKYRGIRSPKPRPYR